MNSISVAGNSYPKSQNWTIIVSSQTRRIAGAGPRFLQTYVHGIILVEVLAILGLAHQDDDGRGAVERAFLGTKVILPRAHEVGDALLEEPAINLDLRHPCWKKREMMEDGLARERLCAETE